MYDLLIKFMFAIISTVQHKGLIITLTTYRQTLLQEIDHTHHQLTLGQSV